jgi:2,4-dienoyl-CoA reductase-like NADH-dependent reductase (Old Yellow Enzyme family)
VLFSPLALPGVTLPNRLVLPAMVTRLSGEDGQVNDDVRERYVRFATGGVGLLVVEAMAVSESKSGPLLRISNDSYLPGLRDLVTRCHDAGPGKVFPQIIHFLKISRSGWRQTVDMLSPDDIEQIVVGYERAAVRAREAGFDGVELHMAHAYTLSSFLSRRNPRRDAYGGTLQNRLRLPMRVLTAVRQAVGNDFAVGLRFVGDECIRGGYTVKDAGDIAVALARSGADYISLSAGGKFEDARVIEGEPLYPYTGYSGDRCMPGANYPDGANLYIPAHVRATLRSAGLQTPVIAAGKIGTPELAEKVLADGTAELVGMARALLADPDLPNKWKSGRASTVVRCIYGNVCKALDESFKRVDCTLWPKAALVPLGKKGVAPQSTDTVPPAWPVAGAGLTADASLGRVLLRWQAATDNEAVYGYEIFRAESHAPRASTEGHVDAAQSDTPGPGNAHAGSLEHYASVRAGSLRFEDARVLPGVTYAYVVQPYDLAGNRGPRSSVVRASIIGDPQEASTAPTDPSRVDACIGRSS